MAQAAPGPASGWARGKGGGHWHLGRHQAGLASEIGCGHHHWHLNNPLQVASAGESATGGPRHWQ